VYKPSKSYHKERSNFQNKRCFCSPITAEKKKIVQGEPWENNKPSAFFLKGPMPDFFKRKTCASYLPPKKNKAQPKGAKRKSCPPHPLPVKKK